MENSIQTTYPIPTGYLFTGDYAKGSLETLSIGDYGKHYNILEEGVICALGSIPPTRSTLAEGEKD